MVFNDVNYEVIYSKRKSLSIEVTRDCKVIVRSPLRISQHKINDFVASRYDWILKALKKQKNRTDILSYTPDQLEKLKQNAKNILPQRVEYYSKIMGLYPTSVKINLARTRFGSCSPKNSINFSAYLMLYPSQAIDYVVVHELAHIKYKNHKKEFYNLIEKYLPDYKNYAALLKK